MIATIARRPLHAISLREVEGLWVNVFKRKITPLKAKIIMDGKETKSICDDEQCIWDSTCSWITGVARSVVKNGIWKSCVDSETLELNEQIGLFTKVASHQGYHRSIKRPFHFSVKDSCQTNSYASSRTKLAVFANFNYYYYIYIRVVLCLSSCNVFLVLESYE